MSDNNNAENRGRLTLADVEALDDQFPGDMVRGYLDGFAGRPWPDRDPSPAYEHGRRNGVNDRSGARGDDDDSRLLALEYRLREDRR